MRTLMSGHWDLYDLPGRRAVEDELDAAMAAALVRGDARSWAALEEVLPKATFADVQKAHWLASSASSASGASHTTFPVLCNGFKVLHEEMKYHLGLEC